MQFQVAGKERQRERERRTLFIFRDPLELKEGALPVAYILIDVYIRAPRAPMRNGRAEALSLALI